MLSQSLFPNFGQGPFPKIAGKKPWISNFVLKLGAFKVTIPNTPVYSLLSRLFISLSLGEQ